MLLIICEMTQVSRLWYALIPTAAGMCVVNLAQASAYAKPFAAATNGRLRQRIFRPSRVYFKNQYCLAVGPLFAK